MILIDCQRLRMASDFHSRPELPAESVNDAAAPDGIMTKIITTEFNLIKLIHKNSA